MKFTLSWLKDYLDTDATAEDIAQALTALGLELESMEDRASLYAPFKAAYVEKADKHPDADKLKVCLVDTGTDKIQVVCGAPNARAGMKGVFAPEGAYIPGSDIVLKKGKIRGEESCGMLVSAAEMNLSEDDEGIIELPEDTPVGTPLADLFGLNDVVYDIAITPNRADCTGIYGIARDLAAGGLGRLKPLQMPDIKGSSPSPVRVDIRTLETNPLFIGRTIRSVKNGPSPDWMQNRLRAVGLRPISALVDITNYMSIAYGRPLHVYDIDRLKGDIHVRLSQKGESFEALNDKSYTLEEGMTAICDDSGVLGLGGIVGGISTGCEEDTVNVFVESAYFEPLCIARAGRALQIESDARYRFERGVDPEFTATGMEIATELILELCGGEASETTLAGEMPQWQRTIEFDPDYVLRLCGVEIEASRQKEILENLGFTVSRAKPDGKTKKERWNVQPPSWRGDIEGRADLVEEIVRVCGYDLIPAVPVRAAAAVPPSSETLPIRRGRLARNALAASGLNECVTWSFMPAAKASLFSANDNPDLSKEAGRMESLTLTNPISVDLAQMRPSIVPNLLEAAQRNADKALPGAALFEVGPVYLSARPDGQKLVAAGVRQGAKAQRHWASPNSHRNVDAFDGKRDALGVLEACGLSTGSVQISREVPGYYHPGRAGALRMGPTILGYFGDLHPAVLEELDIDAPAVAFEVFLDHIPQAKRKSSARPLLTLSPLQPVSRDFAFLVDENVEAAAIVRAAGGADKQLISTVEVFDIYQGKGVESQKKSVAINVTIQPRDHTLTESEIDGISQKIADSVAAKTGGTLRG